MPSAAFVEMNIQHLDQVRDIYNYYVTNTTISFHTEELSLEQMKASVFNKDNRFKSFVIMEGIPICGYVLITQFKSKQAYNGSGEITIYLKPGYAGRGFGGQALAFIEEAARGQQFYTLIATICTENTASIALFRKNGYEQCAMFKGIGYKFGRRLDIVSFQKILG